MIKNKKSLFLLTGLVLTQPVNALEIDEKLTLRLLNVSSSQRTVLTNRGAEDGLVVGDHAKFFITAGVIARGVVEKVSPTRSVWSLYRLVDSNEIVKDKVLNIKISTPAKITDDPSRSLNERGIPVAGTDTFITGNGDSMSLSDGDNIELQELDQTPSAPNKKTRSKLNVDPNISKINDIPIANTLARTAFEWEVFGTAYVNSLSGSAVSDTEGSTYDVDNISSSQVAFSLGVEKYFFNTNSFFKDLSIFGFLHKRSMESGTNFTVTDDILEYGAGVNYHFYNPTNSINGVVGYLSMSAGMGSSTSKTSLISNGNTVENVDDGSTTFFSFGIGAKYTLRNGFGARAIVDYYSSSIETTHTDEIVTTTMSGPRIQIGLSYRF